MAPTTYTSVVLRQRPKDAIVSGETFAMVQKPVPSASDLKEGEILLESLYLSLDPAMRGWLNGSRLPFLTPATASLRPFHIPSMSNFNRSFPTPNVITPPNALLPNPRILHT
jgi:hypothetical protein